MKVLIVSLDNLGDTVISLAIREALKASPDIRVAFWTKDYSGDAVSLAGPEIEHFRCDPFWDRSPGTGKGSLLPYLRTLLAIRAARFDAALILHSNWRKNLSCLLAGIGLRYAHKGAFATRLLPEPETGRHELDFCRSLVAALTGRDPGALSYPLQPAAFGETPAAFELFSSGSWAVVHPFSGNSRRNLPLSSWNEIVDFLRARGLKVLVNASASEKLLFQEAVSGAREADLSFACDLQLDVRSLAFAISRARIFIGNNSGPLHLASALGVPSVGIFQQSWVEKISPRGLRAPRLAVFTETPSEISSAEITAMASGLLDRPGAADNC